MDRFVYGLRRNGVYDTIRLPKGGGNEERAQGLPGAPTAQNFPFYTSQLYTDAGSMLASYENPNREYLGIQNASDTDITIRFGMAANALDFLIGPAQAVEWAIKVPKESLYVFCTVADKPYVIMEQ